MNMNYIGSSGNSYSLNARVLIREADFHTWAFEPKTTQLKLGERISYFKKSASAYKVVLIIRGSQTQRRAILSALHDEFENDVRNKTPGKITFGNWYANCYVISSNTEALEDVTHWTQNTIEIYVPSGMWIKEEEKHFSAYAPIDTGFLEYTYPYPYDYTPPSVGNSTWLTDAAFPADFEMRISGPCVNPTIMVNGYPYMVRTTVPEGSTLVINSKNHTVMMGDQNLFDARNKVKSVFEKIPAGSLSISWGGFAFDLTLYEERSEPNWS